MTQKSYKVNCKVDKMDGKEKVDYPLFVKEADSADDARYLAKVYVIEKGWIFYEGDVKEM